MQHVGITEKLMVIDTARQSFDMQEITNRRFMFSPASGTLILGDQYQGNQIISHHLEEYRHVNTNEPFNNFILGWVGTGGRYTDGVIHFTPTILKGKEDLYQKGFSALEMFGKNGAASETVVRGFPGAWEQPLSGLLTPERERENAERGLNEPHFTADKACAIFERTHDGNGLEPAELHLVISAVHENLTGAGMDVFNGLYKRVMAGEYAKPWLHDVEPMTRGHEGFIFYKDKQVEHYSKFYVFSLEAKRDLTELRNRCEYLERNGLEVSSGTAVWGWEKHSEVYGQEKRAELDRVLAGGGITFSKAVIYQNWNTAINFFTPGIPDWRELKNSPEFMDLYKNSDRELAYKVSIQSCRYGGNGGAEKTGSPEAMSLIPSCFTYLQVNGLLEEIKSQNLNIEPEREGEADNDMDDEMEGAF